MGNNMTKTQQSIVDSIIKEFASINKVFDKPTKKTAFDLSHLVDDIADKQKAINESKSLKVIFEKAMYAQMDKDVKKLNKALNHLGFRVETNLDRGTRLRYPNPEKYPKIIIGHKTNRYQVNFDTYEHRFEIDYVMKCEHTLRPDVSTPIGFELELRGPSNNTFRVTIKKIEDAFENEKLESWIKTQYEQATLVH